MPRANLINRFLRLKLEANRYGRIYLHAFNEDEGEPPMEGGWAEGSLRVRSVSGSWTSRIACPVSGRKVAQTPGAMEMREVEGNADGEDNAVEARVILLLQDDGDYYWTPMSEWRPMPSEASASWVWAAFLQSVELAVLSSGPWLARGGITHRAIPTGPPRKIPAVNGAVCPCDDCQIRYAAEVVAGGKEGFVAVNARITEINRKLGKVQSCLHVEWIPDVRYCADCEAPHIEALARCTDRRGAVLWGMGGTTAQEALDGIESWAWGTFVANMHAKMGIGITEA